jgi:hypothetical protein
MSPMFTVRRVGAVMNVLLAEMKKAAQRRPSDGWWVRVLRFQPSSRGALTVASVLGTGDQGMLVDNEHCGSMPGGLRHGRSWTLRDDSSETQKAGEICPGHTSSTIQKLNQTVNSESRYVN